MFISDLDKHYIKEEARNYGVHLVNPDDPVLGGVGLLQHVKLKVLEPAGSFKRNKVLLRLRAKLFRIINID